MQNLFKNVLSKTHEVLNEHGADTMVFPEKQLLTAFDISRIQRDIYDFIHYSYLFQDADQYLKASKVQLESLRHRLKEQEGYEWESGFQASDYLAKTSISVQKYIDVNGADSNCHPNLGWVLEPYFNHYHRYKFLESHMAEMRFGEEAFLSEIGHLRDSIAAAKIHDTFYWDNHDLDIVHDFNNAVEELKQETGGL